MQGYDEPREPERPRPEAVYEPRGGPAFAVETGDTAAQRFISDELTRLRPDETRYLEPVTVLVAPRNVISTIPSSW